MLTKLDKISGVMKGFVQSKCAYALVKVFMVLPLHG